MLKDKIITLGDGREYVVVSDLNFADRMFVMCAEINLKNDTIKDQELVIREVVANGDNVNLLSLKNDKELKTITKLILSKAHLEAV